MTKLGRQVTTLASKTLVIFVSNLPHRVVEVMDVQSDWLVSRLGLNVTVEKRTSWAGITYSITPALLSQCVEFFVKDVSLGKGKNR